jgi:hypothetical protein
MSWGTTASFINSSSCRHFAVTEPEIDARPRRYDAPDLACRLATPG